MDMDAALQTFFSESRELLENMETQLLQLEGIAEEELQENLNAVFRAAHTIKGSAGIFNLDFIVSFTHVVESVLDRMRNYQIRVDESIVSLLLQCRDHISLLVDCAEQSGELEKDTVFAGEQLLGQLQQYLTVSPDNSEHLETLMPLTVTESPNFERLTQDTVANDCWHISIRFGLNSFRDGMDPISFITYLGTLGQVLTVSPLSEFLPALADYDCESCYMGFQIHYQADITKQQIDDVFEFVKEDSELRIIAPNSQLSEYIELIESMPEIDRRLGEILVQSGALTQSELDKALRFQSEEDIKLPIGEIISQSDVSLEPVLSAALQKQSKVRDSIVKEQKSLRVDADKLDDLINLVGELVTAGAGTSLLAEALGNTELVESVSILGSLLEEVRDAALKLRMVPIGATFSRFQRVVRDIAKELGKDIELEITGADTELDKSVVEKIGDPLMHLVRNAIDHGIESQEERLANNKPSNGVISLNAYHDSGNIVIEVGDDGKGLNSDIIRRKAIEKGLIDESSNLSREELYNIIFEPGFSTAAQVSNLSGRGVGMDVVKRNITELRGRVEVLSEPNVGTTIRIILPLTLAIIDGFVIGVADERYVLPLDVVQECLELTSPMSANTEDELYINLRGQVLPLIFLRDYLEIKGTHPKRQNVVVVQSGGQLAGLVVDRLLGEFQTVIKPLGKLFSKVGCISGSTILGNGSVALILDIHGLMESIIAYEQLQFKH